MDRDTLYRVLDAIRRGLRFPDDVTLTSMAGIEVVWQFVLEFNRIDMRTILNDGDLEEDLEALADQTAYTGERASLRESAWMEEVMRLHAEGEEEEQRESGAARRRREEERWRGGVTPLLMNAVATTGVSTATNWTAIDGAHVQRPSFVGLDITVDNEEQYEWALREMEERSEGDRAFIQRFRMPCGMKMMSYENLLVWLRQRQRIPCPCGNPNHWLIKITIGSEEDGEGERGEEVGNGGTGAQGNIQRGEAGNGEGPPPGGHSEPG